LEFKIAARGEVREDLFDYGRGVTEARNEGSAMDIVKGPGVDPIIFCVVDLESTIWWNARDSY
jgi:hypothetical protein